MNKPYLLLFISFIYLSQSIRLTHHQEGSLEGGVSAPVIVDATNLNEDLKKVDDFVRKQSQDVKDLVLLEYTSQVVAGTKYVLTYGKKDQNGKYTNTIKKQVVSKPWLNSFTLLDQKGNTIALQETTKDGQLTALSIKRTTTVSYPQYPGQPIASYKPKQFVSEPDQSTQQQKQIKRINWFLKRHSPDLHKLKLLQYRKQGPNGQNYGLRYGTVDKNGKVFNVLEKQFIRKPKWQKLVLRNLDGDVVAVQKGYQDVVFESE